MKHFLISVALIMISAGSFMRPRESPAIAFDDAACPAPKSTDITGTSEGWESMPLPDGFSVAAVTFGEKGEIVLLGSDLRISKDGGKSWRVITAGKGFDRCTQDGGRTFDKDCTTASKKPQKIKFVGDVNYTGDVRSPTMTADGRLYLSTFYEHHGALWSIPLENPNELWYGLHFTYRYLPEDMKYWTTDTFVGLQNKIFVSAASSEDDDYNWLTTDDQGKTWRATRFDFDKFFINRNEGLRIVENQIEQTRDGGRNWKIISSPKTLENTFATDFIDDKTGFAAGDDGLLAVTKDGGREWRTISLGIEETLYAVAALDEKHAWAAGEKGFVFETSDGGETWQTVDLEFKGDTYSLFTSDGLKIDKFRRAVWLINDGKVYRKNVR